MAHKRGAHTGRHHGKGHSAGMHGTAVATTMNPPFGRKMSGHGGKRGHKRGGRSR